MITLSYLFSSFFEENTITTRRGSSCKLGVFVFASAVTKKTKELTLFLLFGWARGAGNGRCGSGAGRGLQGRLDPGIQFRDRSFDPIEIGCVVTLSPVLFPTQITYFRQY